MNVATTSRSTSAGSRPADFQAADGGLGAKVACRLVREGEPAFMNPRPVDDPFGIEAVGLEQVLIGDDQLGT